MTTLVEYIICLGVSSSDFCLPPAKIVSRTFRYASTTGSLTEVLEVSELIVSINKKQKN